MKPGPNDKTRRAPRRLAALVLALLAASLSTGCSLGIALAIIELAGKDGGTTVDDNVAPSVTISTVMRTKGLVGIPVTVFDANNDDVTLTGTYDIGGGPQLATLIGSSVVTGSGAGTPALMTWDAPTDLGGTAYVGSVAFSFAGNDSKTNGPASTVAIFEFGNDSPTLNSVTVDTDPLGRVGDIAAVRFQVSDSSSDDVSVTSFEYSLLGDFSDAVVVPLTTGQGGNFPVGTLSGLSTTLALIEYSFAWDVASALETNQAGARIRVQLQDEFGDTSTVVQSPSFFLHTGGDPPSAFLIDIKEPDIDGERCGTILIVYELFDNDGQPADVRIEFSTDNKQTWTLCTEYPSLLSEGRYELAANDDGVVHWFVWDAPVDLVQHPTVHLRVTAADISGVGQPNETQFPLKIGLSEFNPADVFFTGGSTFGGAVGDVSGNSLLDFVVTNSQSNDVTVLLQQYDHRFVENGPFSTDGIGPRSPQLVDVTGDTLKDIVLVNSSSNQISVLEGDGAGDFPNTPILSNTGGVAGSAGSECALQNFTADAFPDIAVTNATSNNVTVLTNDGAGNFTLAATLTDGTEPRSVTTARFDAGATFDLAVANRSSDDVSIFLGNGDGTFGSAINVKVGLHPICVRAVHLNPDIDAIMDLAVTCNGDNSLWLLFGDGAGGFTTTNLPLAGGPSSVSVADHDGDGKNDLFVTLRQANRVAILIGNGTGGFALHTVYDTEPLPGFIATVDFDQDGHTDILMTHQSTGVTASVLLSRDTPSLTFASSDFYSTGLYPETVRTADLDMDGKLDLVVVNGGGDSVTVLPGVGDGTFEFGFDYGTSTSPTDVAFADVNSDNFLDMLITSKGDNEVAVLLGDGDFGFSAGHSVSTGQGPHRLVVADFNGDADVDMAVSCFNDDNVEIYFGDGGGEFSFDSQIGTSRGPMGLALGDFDNDKQVDIAVACITDSEVLVLTGDGSGSFSAQSPTSLGGGSGPIDLAAAAFGPDTDLDLVVVTQGTGDLVLMKGNGDGTLGSSSTFPLGGTGGGVAVADINGDGFIDILGSNSGDGRVFLFYGKGDSTFVATGVPIIAGYGPMGLCVADFNADSTPDLAVARNFEDAVGVHLGRRIGGDWSVDLTAFTPGPETGNIVGGLPGGNDAFGNSRVLAIGQRYYQCWSDDLPDDLRAGDILNDNDFYNRVRLNVPSLPGQLEPLSAAWVVSGDVRLHQHPDEGTVDTGGRATPLNRFGARLTPGDNDDLRRAGFDLSPSLFANQRGVVIDMAMTTSRSTSELNTAFAAGRIHVYQRQTKWVMADQVNADPNSGDADADTILPRVDFGFGEGYRTIYVEVHTWVEIPRATTGLLSSDQAGARFVIADVADPQLRRVRVLTDSGGVFKAFYEP